MGAATFLRALTLLILTASAFSDQHFLVIFPAFIHHPSTEKFCIFLDSFSKSVHVSVTLEMKLQNHTLLEKDVTTPGTFECTSFQVPKFVPRNKDFGFHYEEEVAHVHVLIQHDKSTFENRKKVLVKNAYKRTLIELDKPFYKPGEEVKFRIVTLDEKFQIIEEAVSITLFLKKNINSSPPNIKNQILTYYCWKKNPAWLQAEREMLEIKWRLIGKKDFIY